MQLNNKEECDRTERLSRQAVDRPTVLVSRFVLKDKDHNFFCEPFLFSELYPIGTRWSPATQTDYKVDIISKGWFNVYLAAGAEAAVVVLGPALVKSPQISCCWVSGC